MLSSILHGIFAGTAVVLVVFGAAKILTRGTASQRRQTRAHALRRVLTIHEDAPRLVGGTETVVGAISLVFLDSRWPAVAVTGVGAVFVGVLAVRLRVMPGSGCGCIKAAADETYLALSSVCRAAAVCVGGVCGVVSAGHANMVLGDPLAAAVVWLLALGLLSPELWGYLNLRCGRPLVFSVQDDRRRLGRSPGYQRLRDAELIARRPADVW
jgi:hypothetical protein